MDIGERIKFDFSDLESYFSLISTALQSSPEWSYRHSSARYNMITDVYGCLEFWLKEICTASKRKHESALGYNDIRADNDLAVYNKYLNHVVSFDMGPVKSNYDQLQNLRKVRNCIVHSGAHTNDESIDNISGIKLDGSLIVVSEEFVQHSINNSKVFLLHAKNA